MSRQLPITSCRMPTRSGDLELLSCLPQSRSNLDNTYRPILFLHGAFCSARDFQFLLPYLATRGIPAYALSVRGHGGSWRPCWCRYMLLTSIKDYAADAAAALALVTTQHPGPLPVVAGHSFGGGIWQYLLARERRRGGPKLASGLILLASIPATGRGRKITANWETVEAPPKHSYPWSQKGLLDTPQRVRDAFFSPSTDEAVVEKWMQECRTELGSSRVGLRTLWRLAKEEDVLAALTGFKGVDDDRPGSPRMILSIAAEKDRLVKKQLVLDNSSEYRKVLERADSDEPASTLVRDVILTQGGHHIMMDVCWEQCAALIAAWIQGH